LGISKATRKIGSPGIIFGEENSIWPCRVAEITKGWYLMVARRGHPFGGSCVVPPVFMKHTVAHIKHDLSPAIQTRLVSRKYQAIEGCLNAYIACKHNTRLCTADNGGAFNGNLRCPLFICTKPDAMLSGTQYRIVLKDDSA
jgi:hypothetical protein